MKYSYDLTEGPIFKKFVRFVYPVILTGFLQQLYNSADIMIVGQFAGPAELAAVGATSTLANLIIALFLGLSVGTNVVCAGLFGADNREGLEKALHTSVLMGVLLGIPLSTIGWFGSKYFLSLMGTPSDIIDLSVLYMKLYFLGVPANLIFNFGAAVMRAMGNTQKPMQILAVSGVANVVLNIVCVVFLDFGVVGVALGTIVAQVISAVWVLLFFASSKSDLRLKISGINIYPKEFKRILAIGIPSGINSILFSLSNVFLQSAVNSFGKDTVAAHSAAWTFLAFSNLLVSASEQGTVSFVGQNMGAKKYERIGKIVKTGLAFAGISTVIFTSIIVWQGRFFLGLFTPDAKIVEIGMIQLYISISVYVLYVPDMVLGGALRGMGRSILPTAINVVGICVLRVVWVTCIWPLNPTLQMLYYSFPVTWLVSGLMMIVAYLICKKRGLSQSSDFR